MNKQEALERYEALPVPDKTQEPWMFTDLKGFDPATFSANGAAAPMLMSTRTICWTSPWRASRACPRAGS